MILHGVTQLFANGLRAWLLRRHVFALAAIVVARPMVSVVMGAIPLAPMLLPARLAPSFERPRHALLCGVLRRWSGRWVGALGLVDVWKGVSELGLARAW